MTNTGLTRRKALQSAGCALAGAAGLVNTARAWAGTEPNTGTGTDYEAVIRRWYRAWENKDQDQFEALMDDRFTFTSAAGDNHISRSSFRTQCWETQAPLIARFDLEEVFGRGNEALVRYLCHTRNGKSFRNVEYFRLKGGKVETLACYFGEKSSFPSAVSRSS